VADQRSSSEHDTGSELRKHQEARSDSETIPRFMGTEAVTVARF